MVYGCYSTHHLKREAVSMPMKVVLHYRANGVLRDWVCMYDRLDHVLNVCATKGFEVVGIEDLA